jgi:D-beta-D-heptose 7-phosphate kinase / D-beta-D-heptose 1-phosphate adenosyltransferase
MLEMIDIPEFNKTKILVFGDLILDCYWLGLSQRVSPEAPVPVVKIEKKERRPGGAANVAMNLSAIGCDVALLGVVGKDQEALDLTSELEAQNVSCFFHYLSEGQTISKLRVIARNQQMIRLDFDTCIEDDNDERLLRIYQERIREVDVVLLSDYAKGTLKDPLKLIEMANQKNIPVVVDPKGRDFSIYAGATLITPNLSEFEAVVGKCADNESLIITKAKALMRAHHFKAILVTRGKDGMSLVFADDREPLHLLTHAREVFDVTGAGDTVIALMAAGIASGIGFEKTAYLANVAAGLVIKKMGTAAVSVPELRQSLRNILGVDQGVLTESDLKLVVKDTKEKGEKIVMTNGCFDILHAGHIQYLNQAKDLGDRLIVAVNTDESVARLKGEDRPINPLPVRMEILSALRSVDWVVPFSEDTPARLIGEILPDYLVKGGDYKESGVVGSDIVKSNGGEVIILPFREGHSTTGLVNKLKGE